MGLEVSPKQGHYLAFGVEHEIPSAGRSARQIAAAVRAADAAEAWHTPAQALRWLRDPEPAVAHGPPAHHLRRPA